jgi:hypothetical protein
MIYLVAFDFLGGGTEMEKVQLLTPYEHLIVPCHRLMAAIQSLNVEHVKQLIIEDLARLDIRMNDFSDTNLGINEAQFENLCQSLTVVLSRFMPYWSPQASVFFRDQLMGRGKSFNEAVETVANLVRQYTRRDTKWVVAVIPDVNNFIVYDQDVVEIKMVVENDSAFLSGVPQSNQPNDPNFPPELWKKSTMN